VSIHTSPRESETPIPVLIKRLIAEIRTLVGQELTLAKLELKEKFSHVATAGKMFAVAAVMGIAMFATITVVFIAALSLVVPVWAAALIVTVVYGGLAGACALVGIRAIKALAHPLEKTIRSVKEDASAISTSIARGR